MSKDTQQIPATYSVRLPIEMRRRLEDASQAGGRSLHAEILMRLEASLNPPRLDWRKIIDPAVCAALEYEASAWNTTFEEALSYKLQEHLDVLLHGLFLEDLSGEAMVRRITLGQVLDDRLAKANKKYQESPQTPQSFYPFSDVDKVQEYRHHKPELQNYLDQMKNLMEKGGSYAPFKEQNIETLMRQIAREEITKAGITLPPDEQPKKGKGVTEGEG